MTSECVMYCEADALVMYDLYLKNTWYRLLCSVEQDLATPKLPCFNKDDDLLK